MQIMIERDNGLTVGNLVMLKVQPKYKLNRRYKGPFIIKTLTDTNVVIQVQRDPNAEEINVTQQQLSKCVKTMEKAKPWVEQLET